MMTKVYRYDFYDRVLKRDRRSVDYATADAIQEMHGTILSDTERVVDDELIGNDGTIRAMQVFMEPPARPARRQEPRAR
jgi:hypothetical protein